MNEIIKFRPHHILCSQFFIGNGYSEKFVENMTEILNSLNKQNIKIKFVQHCDDICSCCPKNENGKCINEEHILSIDKSCMMEYNFKTDDEFLWNDIKSKVINKILSENKLPCVCDNCQWLSVCKSINLKDL